MLEDADKQAKEFQQITMAFLCPPGFEPAAYLITAMDKEGHSFTNAPTDQPAVALALATKAIDFASQHAIMAMQSKRERSAIIRAPAGSIPTFPGPEGRG